MIKRYKSPHKASALITIGIALVAGALAWAFNHSLSFDVLKQQGMAGNTVGVTKGEPETLGAFSGIACDNASTRPMAVMLAGDSEARPLSGLQEADMVVEMPVIVNSITRYMAIFQCGQPAQIGSVRSARGSFIGIAKGYQAMFAHWGGEHEALSKLQNGVIDNIDALPNPYDAFWRKPAIPQPHNGFTSYERLTQAAQKLHYSLAFDQKPFFTFSDSVCADCLKRVISIPYPGLFAVSYRYDPLRRTYLRFKGGTPEVDALTKTQVTVTNVIVVWTTIYHTYSQYDTIELDGKSGTLQAFIAGNIVQGTWKKESFSSPLLFFDAKGKTLVLHPGNTWVQIVALGDTIGINPPLATPLSPPNP